MSLLPAVKKSAVPGLIPARVLVVDHEPLIRWSICAALIAAGFDANSAATSEEACRIAAAGPPPHVVILDVHPDGQPQPLLLEIRAINPGARFLVISTARRTSETMLQFGDIEVVEKPFDLALLVKAVAALAALHPATPV